MKKKEKRRRKTGNAGTENGKFREKREGGKVVEFSFQLLFISYNLERNLLRGFVTVFGI